MEKFFEAVFRFGQKLPPVAREINRLGERFARQVRRARLKARGITPPDELSEEGKEQILTSPNTKTRIAQGILHVLDEEDKRPPNQTQLLNRVDELRSTKYRTSYRELRRYEDDPPTSVDVLEQWAREETGEM